MNEKIFYIFTYFAVITLLFIVWDLFSPINCHSQPCEKESGSKM